MTIDASAAEENIDDTCSVRRCYGDIIITVNIKLLHLRLVLIVLPHKLTACKGKCKSKRTSPQLKYIYVMISI
jgi:hypothetical protein